MSAWGLSGRQSCYVCISAVVRRGEEAACSGSVAAVGMSRWMSAAEGLRRKADAALSGKQRPLDVLGSSQTVGRWSAEMEESRAGQVGDDAKGRGGEDGSGCVRPSSA